MTVGLVLRFRLIFLLVPLVMFALFILLFVLLLGCRVSDLAGEVDLLELSQLRLADLFDLEVVVRWLLLWLVGGLMVYLLGGQVSQ
jgi:hypothetical protein